MKFYVFADESGGQAPGGSFVVGVAVFESSAFERLEEQLRRLELRSLRDKKKWRDSRPEQRTAYLRGLADAAALCLPFYWRPHDDKTSQEVKVAEVVAAAIRDRDAEDIGRRSITIDALTEAKRTIVLRVLKSRGIGRKEVPPGKRDQSTPFLRLADALAGFMRHVYERERYAVELWEELGPLFRQV